LGNWCKGTKNSITGLSGPIRERYARKVLKNRWKSQATGALSLKSKLDERRGLKGEKKNSPQMEGIRQAKGASKHREGGWAPGKGWGNQLERKQGKRLANEGWRGMAPAGSAGKIWRGGGRDSKESGKKKT